MTNLATRMMWFYKRWSHTWLQVEGSESDFLSTEPEQTYVD